MILSDIDILKLHEARADFITPFNLDRLGGASYDVSLGGEVSPILSISNVVDISNRSARDTLYQNRIPLKGFVMKPGQYCLASLAEKLSFPDDVVGCVLPRTRFTRAGLLVASQFCNPSYSGRLWIGLQNVSDNNLHLSSNVPIAQIVFFRLSSTPSDFRLYRNQTSANYQNENSSADGHEELPLTESGKLLYKGILADLLHSGEL